MVTAYSGLRYIIFEHIMMEVAANLKLVTDNILCVAKKRMPEYLFNDPRLVAVSKLQTVESIVSAYEAGQRHFGENYVNELTAKASHPQILEQCDKIRWHFIGNLQRNKINKVLGVPNLYVVETVDNEKIANVLNNSWAKLRISVEKDRKLNVMVQVNTSREKEKNGCDTNQVIPLVKYILDNCANLKFMGIMTIGMVGYDITEGPNPDFLCLIKCRETIRDELGIDIKDIELSMGMSNDYEHAIELGSTNVRVGSAIFGKRKNVSSTPKK